MPIRIAKGARALELMKENNVKLPFIDWIRILQSKGRFMYTQSTTNPKYSKVELETKNNYDETNNDRNASSMLHKHTTPNKQQTSR